MHGGPRSRSRRSSQSCPWGELRGAICALAVVVALAPGCGSSGPGASVRLGTGGQLGNDGQPGTGGQLADGGQLGNSGAAGHGGAIGPGGSSPGTGGKLVDAGAADALRPWDGGGTCVDDGSHQTTPNTTAASGTFSGMLAGAVCTGGTFAHVESRPADDGGAPAVTLFIDNSAAAAAPGSFRFQLPANAINGLLNVEIGLPSARPGTYGQAQSCGNVVLTAVLDVADPSICAAATDTSNCPDGCEPAGLNECMPSLPFISYAALGAADCLGNPATPVGSWTVTLTALTADPAGPDSSGNLVYAVHGTLSAMLADQSDGAATTGVSLALSF